MGQSNHEGAEYQPHSLLCWLLAGEPFQNRAACGSPCSDRHSTVQYMDLLFLVLMPLLLSIFFVVAISILVFHSWKFRADTVHLPPASSSL